MRYFVFISSIFFIACGGASPSGKPTVDVPEQDEIEVGYDAGDFVPRAVLARAELTTAVDAKRYRSAAPVTTTFSVKERIIYFVGKLRKVPTDAAIEVRWFLDALPDPVLISDVRGSDTFQFIASFEPTQKKFIRGTYTARVYVNDTEIGAKPFEIYDTNAEQRGTIVRNLALSKRVNRKGRPQKATHRFRAGIKKIYIGFDVKNPEVGAVAEVHWTRNGSTFHTEDVQLSGDDRYTAFIASEGGLPDGEYAVQVSVFDVAGATKPFTIGTPSQGPAIGEVALGVALGPDNLPKRATTIFSRDTPVIQCGIRFTDLAPNSVLEVQWVQLAGTEQVVRYKTRSMVSAGGSGSMGASWEPPIELDAGHYRAVVCVNGETLAEEPFTIR
ncbi:MAG: hypothetical protein QNJ97_07740 [Myxococcota bacterium]|nr:hypothetical protein [Myxococcota bacterium]